MELKFQGSIIAIPKTGENIWESYLNVFNYTNPQKEKTYSDFQSFGSDLNTDYFELARNYKFLRGYWENGANTYILDPEMTDFVEIESCCQLSRVLDLPVFNFLHESNSQTKSISRIFKDQKQHFESIGEEIIEGENLLEYWGLQNTQYILSKASTLFGFDLTSANNVEYTSYKLSWTEEYHNQFVQKAQINPPKKQKPKWKFW